MQITYKQLCGEDVIEPGAIAFDPINIPSDSCDIVGSIIYKHAKSLLPIIGDQYLYLEVAGANQWVLYGEHYGSDIRYEIMQYTIVDGVESDIAPLKLALATIREKLDGVFIIPEEIDEHIFDMVRAHGNTFATIGKQIIRANEGSPILDNILDSLRESFDKIHGATTQVFPGNTFIDPLINSMEGIPIDRAMQLRAVQREAFNLFCRKNADYGDAFAQYGPTGVIIRMNDKLQRFISVSKNAISLVDNESLRDTLLDLHNYSAMCIMLMDENPIRGHTMDGGPTEGNTSDDDSNNE